MNGTILPGISNLQYSTCSYFFNNATYSIQWDTCFYNYI